jgi:hypothetical protein
VAHTEFVSDIYTDNAGPSAKQFRINPQDASTFTWLSAIATRFEMYKFHKLKFMYKPSTGTANDGWVALGVDFDAYDTVAPSKVEILAWQMSAKAAVWQSATVDCTRESKIATFRYSDSVGRGDTRLDDLGLLWALAYGQTVFPCGEVFVEYEVEFRQPSYKIPPSLFSVYPPTANTTGTWFDGTTQWIGNIALEWGKTGSDRNNLYVREAGKYLISAYYSVGSGATGINITAGAPVSEPTGQWTLLQKHSTATTANSHVLYELALAVAPVVLTFAGLASGALPRIYFSTFANLKA